MRTFFKIAVVFLLFFCRPFMGISQNEKDRVEALRVSFISQKLELTGSESEKFWPVYNEYNDKVKAIRKNLRQSFRKKGEVLSETEADELYQLDLRSKQAEVDVHKLYSERIRAIIGVKKWVRLKAAEEQFKQEIFDNIQKKAD